MVTYYDSFSFPPPSLGGKKRIKQSQLVAYWNKAVPYLTTSFVARNLFFYYKIKEIYYL